MLWRYGTRGAGVVSIRKSFRLLPVIYREFLCWEHWDIEYGDLDKADRNPLFVVRKKIAGRVFKMGKVRWWKGLE